jgi:hypothetical protein
MSDLKNEATASQEQAFEPMIIGEPDIEAMLQTETQYQKICNVLNELFSAVKEDVFLGKEMSIDNFLEFTKSKDPKPWCYLKYLVPENVKIGDIDVDSAIKLELFKIRNIETIIQLHDNLKNLNGKEVRFNYPLHKLYVAELNQFSTETGTEKISDFLTELEKKFSIFTETPEQNQVLEILNTIADNYNKLATMGILRMKNGILELDIVSSFFALDKRYREVCPFKVNSYVFKRHNRLAQFRKKIELTEEEKIKKSNPLQAGFVLQG